MIFAIVAAIVAYRRAKDNGRNGWLWAGAAAAVFVVTQWVVAVGAGVFIGVGIAMFGWSESIFDDTMYTGPVTVLAIGASILTTWLLLRYLDKPMAEEQLPDMPPPPPPIFDRDL